MKQFRALKNFDAGFGHILKDEMISEDRLARHSVKGEFLVSEGLVSPAAETSSVQAEAPEMVARIEDPSRRKGKKAKG